jgi:DNA-binding XRE family transcriptional regulator
MMDLNTGMAARRIPLQKPPTAADVAQLERKQAAMRKRIGAHLKRLRTEAGLSLRQLSMRADVSPSYLSDLERGQHAPTSDLVVRLAHYLSAQPADFFTDET